MDYVLVYQNREQIVCDGYYDRDKKIINFFCNKKIYKAYQAILKQHRLKRLGQTALIGVEKVREKEKMSLDELEEKAAGRVELDDAPKYITPNRIEYEWKEDKDKKECLFVNFFWVEKDIEVSLTQKYTPFHIVRLLDRMKLMKIKNIIDWTEAPWKMESAPFGGVGYPKYLPVQEIEE